MRSERGFTLIEMLVAVTVMGFLVVGLVQGTRLGLQAWRTQSRVVAERDQLDGADRVLRQLIAHLSPAAGIDAAPIAGRPDRLDGVSELPEAVATPTRTVDFRLFVDARQRLILRWRLHLHEVPIGPPPRWNDTELMSGVQQIRFAYGPVGIDQWTNEWTLPTAPPLVKIRLTFAKDDPRHWPEIMAATMMAQASG